MQKLGTIYTNYFGKFLLIFKLGRGPKSGLGKSMNTEHSKGCLIISLLSINIDLPYMCGWKNQKLDDFRSIAMGF